MIDRCYRTLGLNRGAAEADIRRAYRKKALLLHPDRNPNGAEAFKLLQAHYEEVLTDVKRRGAYGGRAPPFSSSPSSAAPAAGAAYRFARAAGTARPPYPPSPTSCFTEKELFGDSIPGGWCDVCARRGAPAQGGSKAGSRGDTEGHSEEINGCRSAVSEEAAAADARWRRAHGTRVPVSAYETSAPAPHPTPLSQPAPSSFSFKSTGTHQRVSSAAAGVSSSTQAQWDSFLSRDHAWKSSPAEASSFRDKGEARGTGRVSESRGCDDDANQNCEPASGSDRDESAADRAYREAMFLHRRMQEFSAKERDAAAEHTRTYSQSSRAFSTEGAHVGSTATHSTEQVGCHQRNDLNTSASSGAKDEGHEAKFTKKEALHPQCRDVEATSRHRPNDGRAATSSDDDNDDASAHSDKCSGAHDSGAGSGPSAALLSGASWNDEPRAGDMFPAKQSPVPSSHNDERLKRDSAHRHAILDERRLLQKEYFRYRYTPNPADVAEMSDMEVYLLASLSEDIYHKMQAVMAARLSKGPCSCCASAPRARRRLCFTCTHPSICEGCCASGVSKCPLCGAARTDRPSPAPPPSATAFSSIEQVGTSGASSASRATRTSLSSSSRSLAAATSRPGPSTPPVLTAEETVK
ncbi:DnaJ domain containing protein, putative [Leishmania lindenbergi]|uniref:DnaJ domain containing protein n=1 Tax=Leishmania lindenbergi TaxID=651832 RepID=A0AAW3AT49_9TRYP